MKHTDSDVEAADRSEYPRRLYCMGCTKFIEAEVRYDPTSNYPVVRHNGDVIVIIDP